MKETIARAIATIKANDQGIYTVPTHGLYPFQWNWDSCLTALGFAHFDVERAWVEIETLFEHQWDDGMVPHIIFHQENDGYFPGPNIWNTGRPVPTSGITQPPVAGYCLKKVFDRTEHQSKYIDRLRILVKKIHAWHQWFYECRDPKSEGLVAIIHPWESGRDNSVDWDEALARVPTDGVKPFKRRDTVHANPEHRPTQHQYERYIWLVQRFESENWNNAILHDCSPFRVVDPGFNAMLLRSISDIGVLASHIGEIEIANACEGMAAKGIGSLEKLWNDKLGQYVCFDRVNQKQINNAAIGGLVPVLTEIPHDRKQMISDTIRKYATRFGIPSQDPQSDHFERYRYWRGPIWLIINYMIAEGLSIGDQRDLSRQISDTSLDLIKSSGFAEYYDPIDGTGCGGQSFSWTAAMVLEFIDKMHELAHTEPA
jgi:glycogen debranching enzyme